MFEQMMKLKFGTIRRFYRWGEHTCIAKCHNNWLIVICWRGHPALLLYLKLSSKSLLMNCWLLNCLLLLAAGCMAVEVVVGAGGRRPGSCPGLRPCLPDRPLGEQVAGVGSNDSQG